MTGGLHSFDLRVDSLCARFPHDSRTVSDDFHNSHRQAPPAGPLLLPMTSQRAPFSPQWHHFGPLDLPNGTTLGALTPQNH